MDNKVTKKRVALHFEYDWLKYVLVILASVFVFYMIFMQINITREFERIDVFFACYSNNNAALDDDFLDKLGSEGDDVIREVNIQYQTPVGEYYQQLFTSAGFTADILVVTESDMHRYADWFLEMDDYVLDGIFAGAPDGVRDGLEYYVYSEADREPDKVNPNSVGKKFGIRVDNLKKLAVDNPPYIFDVRKLDPSLTEEELSVYDSKFYIVLDKNSVKIGEKGKKEQYRDLKQSFRFVRFFLEKYW